MVGQHPSKDAINNAGFRRLRQEMGLSFADQIQEFPDMLSMKNVADGKAQTGCTPGRQVSEQSECHCRPLTDTKSHFTVTSALSAMVSSLRP